MIVDIRLDIIQRIVANEKRLLRLVTAYEPEPSPKREWLFRSSIS
jgi:hypothetical protein